MDETKLINTTCDITIRQTCDKVFEYYTDPRNDSKWRKEINSTTLSGEQMTVGTHITESSFLSGKMPNYVSELTCISYVPGKQVVMESVAANPYWAKSSRTTAAIGDKLTRVTYTLEFDMDIVKHGLGFGLPKFFVAFYTKQTMKKYLKQLQKNLE